MKPEYPGACERLINALENSDVPLRYTPWLREYGILFLDDRVSVLLIEYCPFCGEKLPDSLRNEWFDRLDELGLEPDDDDVPFAMRSDRWWMTPDGLDSA